MADQPQRPQTVEELYRVAAEAEHKQIYKPANVHNNDPRAELAARKEMLAAGIQRGLSTRWWSIMTMQLKGLTNLEIASKLGMHHQTVSNILHTERYRAALKARLGDLDDELYVLKPKAVQAFANGLVSANTDTALRAATEFFKITGQGTYGRSEPAPASTVGAEALAKQLLLAAKQEVHVHVHGPAASSEAQIEAARKEG